MSKKVTQAKVGVDSRLHFAKQSFMGSDIGRRRTPSLPSVGVALSDKKPTPKPYILKTLLVESPTNGTRQPLSLNTKGASTKNSKPEQEPFVLKKSSNNSLIMQETASTPFKISKSLKNSQQSVAKSVNFFGRPPSVSPQGDTQTKDKDTNKSSSTKDTLNSVQPAEEKAIDLFEIADVKKSKLTVKMSDEHHRRGHSLNGSLPVAKSLIPKQGSHVYFNYKGLKGLHKKEPHELGLFGSHLKLHHDIFHDMCRDTFPAHQIRTDVKGIRQEKPLVLVLDLDETLVHCCNFDSPTERQNYQHVLNYKNDKGQIVSAKMTMRPGAKEFLKVVSRHYDLVVYTASESTYAQAVVDWLDPSATLIKAIFSREHCLKTGGGVTVKYLPHILGHKQSSKALLVDNSPQCLALQPCQSIPILPFTYDANDSELEKLSNLLVHAALEQAEPMRFVNNYFCLEHFIKYSNYKDLIQHLSN